MLVPDLIEPIVGWRVWDVTLDEGEVALSSVHTIDRWPAGARLGAECRFYASLGCVAPCEDGAHGIFNDGSPIASCGIHAAKTVERAAKYLPPSLRDPRALALHKTRAVIGRVALTGVVREHEWGYRAEYASVVDVWVPVSFKLLDKWGMAELDAEHAARALRERYEVPVRLFRRLGDVEDA